MDGTRPGPVYRGAVPTFGGSRRVLRAHPHSVDCVVALLAYVTVLAAPVLTPVFTPQHAQVGRFDAVTLVTGIVVCGALAFRRRWPLAVLGVTFAGCIAFLLLERDSGPLIAAAMIAVYTVSHMVPPLWSRSLVIGYVVVLTVVSVAVHHGTENLNTLGWGGFAITAGEVTRNRRSRLADMEERARRAEDTREQEARRRVTEERLRIARDLHDLVGHHIALINVQAGVAGHVLDEQPGQAREALGHIRQACRSALDELAATISLLRQPDDPRAPTEPSVGLDRLAELTDSFAASGLTVTQVVEGRRQPVPAAVDLTAYRVIQESLTNVRKHAQTSAATVRLGYDPAELRITVEDAGIGVESTVDGNGHGIVGMAERAAALGGTMDAGPRPGGGFRVRVTLPISAPIPAPVPS